MYEKTYLTSYEQNLLDGDAQPATVTWYDFKNEVFQALLDYYNFMDITQGNKSIKVKTPYLSADVVVTMQHRKYLSYTSPGDNEYVQGITFNANGQWIVNYPNLH